MTEPPVKGVDPGDGATENLVNAAARDGRRGPPVPHQPTRRQIWGWRAVLLIPAVIGGYGFAGFPAAPGGVGRTVVAAVAGTTLLVFLGLGWWGATQPRLSNTDAARVHSALGRDGTRRLRRALLRTDDVPPELQPWALPYLAQRPWPPLAAVGMSSGPANLLLSTRSGAPDAVDVALTVVVGALLLAVVAGMVVARRMRRHAHHLLHTTSSPAPDAAGRG